MAYEINLHEFVDFLIKNNINEIFNNLQNKELWVFMIPKPGYVTTRKTVYNGLYLNDPIYDRETIIKIILPHLRRDKILKLIKNVQN